ncbi:BsuBI/PstI family type II restriction endonuclease [Streptomyces wuyuanensis]|uniref:BsuBI/PstI family type II restriction endonuclease n=1 Tax=Streptomyces wuyuanensis TaxID=1196353 RepID=UPI0037F66A41
MTSTANRAASAIVFVAMYVGAIGDRKPIRPSTVTWMSDAVAERRSDADRRGYYRAAMTGEKAVEAFCDQIGVTRGKIWYANNSREPVRDESIDALINNGAVLNIRTDLSTNSPLARYVLNPDFAALFSPDLNDLEFGDAVARWRDAHLSVTGRRRAQLLRDPARNSESVSVTLPGADTRTLHPGPSSLILKGVAEEFSKHLQQPNILFISQPGEKVNLLDGRDLEAMGIPVDQNSLLPDCLMADLDDGRDEVWFIEAVFSGGEITNERKASLLAWATSHGLRAEQCRFLSAFESRTHSEARRALSTLADGSFAWFRDEPGYVLAWDVIGPN